MKKVEELLKETLIDINSLEPPEFTKEGFDEYKKQIGKFIIRLYDESMRNSKKNNSDTICEKHISEAVNYISTINKYKFSGLLNTVGGLFVGAAMTFLFSIVNSSPSFSTGTILFYILLGIVGFFILGYSLSKE